MDPNAALSWLGNPSEETFWQYLKEGRYRHDDREVAEGLAQWLNRGGFRPARWAKA